MSIDWAALGIVAVVSLVATVLFAILLGLGIRFVSLARARTGGRDGATAPLTIGYGLLGCAALLVLFGIYLIVPQFH